MCNDMRDHVRFGRSMIGELSVDRDRALASLRVPHDSTEFVLIPQLIRGFGSYRVGLDRGEPGAVRHVKWQRAGASLVLIQLNTRFVATEGAGFASRDSFAHSVIYRAGIIAEDADGVVIDITEFALTDLLDIGPRLSAMGGNAAIDRALSWLIAEESFQHSAGIELTANLTVSGATGEALRVAPVPNAISVTQRLTMIPLPEAPLQARRYHVSSGGYGKRFVDFSLAQNRSQETGWQPRFRLERLDPSVPSAVRVPIVFSVDPEIEEPWRSAIVEGGNWWQEGFERAGFLNAFRVEVRDPGTDPAQAGVNPVWWVHRADRGPSFGGGLTDPRTGEILKGNVRLGSQRIQQLTMLGEALLSPYGRRDEHVRVAAIDRMVTARIRHLAAHEIGHALGFMHNFASHLSDKPSVTDYPFPALALDGAGEVDLSHAYSTGLSEWDIYLVRTAYEQFPPLEEAARLAELRRAVAAAGHFYLSDDDGNAQSSSNPDAVPWTFGIDAIATLDTIMGVRAKALADFSRGAVPPGSHTGELESRFALVHLLHRYQTVAVARLLGGVGYSYGDASDPSTSPRVVSGEHQHRALASIVKLLSPKVLAVPTHVTEILSPPSIRYTRSSADFVGRAGSIFDPLAASAAAAAVVCQHIFEPSRLNRMSVQHALDSTSPGPVDVMGKAFDAVNAAAAPEPALSTQVADTARSVIIQHVVDVLRTNELHASCRRELKSAMIERAARLNAGDSDELQLLLSDHSRPTPWVRGVIPEGWPL